MSITCPTSLQSVKTRDVPPREVCVQGQTSSSMLRSQAKPKTRSLAESTVDIKVKIYSGHDIDIPPDPPAGATDATIDGQDWQACVPTGNLGAAGDSLPGAALTAVAWQLTAGTTTVETIMVQPFYGVVETVTGAGECCVCSGSGASDELTSEMAAAAELDVVVQDGKSKGAYTAKASGPSEWSLTVDKVPFKIRRAKGGLTLEGPAATVKAKSVEKSPFSATFPGAIFGAAGDVVVTLA